MLASCGEHMKPYCDLTAAGQVERIRRPLKSLLESEWGMPASTIRLVSHRYNTTFRVDSPRGRFALRANTGSTHTSDKLLTEIAFVQHVASARTFKAAAPVPKLDGTFIAELDVPGFGRPVPAVLYEWLPDRTVDDKPTKEIMYSLGRATSELHALGSTFRYKGQPFPTLNNPFYGDEYRLPGKDLDLALFEECAERAQRVFTSLEATPKIPIHADLHLQNIKFGRGVLSIFDFDDAIVTWPIMDAAITLWYLRYHSDVLGLESDYWAGFGSSPAGYGLSNKDFETLVAARTLLLVNDIVGTQNAGAQGHMTRFVRRCEDLMRHYLESGRFAPNEVSPRATSDQPQVLRPTGLNLGSQDAST
jgi:Ser/Thr protein kinase RdoA (MazF antagonist)